MHLPIQWRGTSFPLWDDRGAYFELGNDLLQLRPFWRYSLWQLPAALIVLLAVWILRIDIGGMKPQYDYQRPVREPDPGHYAVGARNVVLHPTGWQMPITWILALILVLTRLEVGGLGGYRWADRRKRRAHV